MRRFAHAAVLAVAISAPVLTGALMDHSVVSVLGAPGGCSSSCTVGGAAPGSPAQGGHRNIMTFGGGAQTQSGTVAVPFGQQSTGRIATTNSSGQIVGSHSGNFKKGTGHCTGLTDGCV